ncbi:MAG: PQQ-like beta-propeller repeat protein [Verrucomicrobia bacterium]|nr:PQQ-like beta-propeller repeat protein [Verrucomicrobiota bacterium]
MNLSPTTALIFLAASILARNAGGADNFDWPQWRGPDRTDVSKETGLLKAWPSEGPKRLWLFDKAGQGYSGPAIVGGKLFTMGARDGSECVLVLDADTGQELWATPIGSVFKESRGDGPRATPTVDGDRVYAMTGLGVLACLNVADGKLRWQRSMSDLGGRRPNWGFTESVLVDGERVVCTPGGSKGTLAALDKMTGKLIWQSAEFTDPAHYSSIVPADLNGGRQYIQLTERTLAGVTAKDGKLLWRSSWPGRTAVIPTPIYRDGHVYATAGYGAGCKLVKIGPGNEASDVYENKLMKNHHGGVILVGDHLYGFSDGVGWLCQNLLTGEEVWSEKRALGKGAIACADGMLYCLDEASGTIVLIEASPKAWHEHGRFTPVPQSKTRSRQGRVWTHPVISHGKLYLRDQELIYCYDVKAR